MQTKQSTLKQLSISFALLILSLSFASKKDKYITNVSVQPPSLASSALKVAKQQLGTKYKYGGTKPLQGFDCSGLIYYSYGKLGIQIPRSSRDQFALLAPIAEPIKGNLIYFGRKGRVNHAGIYLGNNLMLHSPSSGKHVEIVRIDTPRWQNRYMGARSVEKSNSTFN